MLQSLAFELHECATAWHVTETSTTRRNGLTSNEASQAYLQSDLQRDVQPNAQSSYEHEGFHFFTVWKVWLI